MKFGPFTMTIARTITDGLSNAKIPFDVEDDKEAYAQEEKTWKEQPPTATKQRGVTFDPAFIFISIEDSLLEEPNPILADLGLTHHHEEPDFSKEEYVCPTCTKVVAEAPGVCGVHGISLQPWSDYVAKKRDESGAALFTGNQLLWAAVALGAAAFGLYAAGILKF